MLRRKPALARRPAVVLRHAGFLRAHDAISNGKSEISRARRCEPSGLGWLPDGRMLVVSMMDQKVLRVEAERARTARRSVRCTPVAK